MIKLQLKRKGGVSADGAGLRSRPSDAVEADLRADEADPSRIVPSAEGEVTFPGLPTKVREWLGRELRSVGRGRGGDKR